MTAAAPDAARAPMLELRQNLATGEWVIIVDERAKRPEEFRKPGARKEAVRDYMVTDAELERLRETWERKEKAYETEAAKMKAEIKRLTTPKEKPKPRPKVSS